MDTMSFVEQLYKYADFSSPEVTDLFGFLPLAILERRMRINGKHFQKQWTGFSEAEVGKSLVNTTLERYMADHIQPQPFLHTFTMYMRYVKAEREK